MACSVMERNGFKTVYNLANGIMYWDGEVVEFN
jgi:rhodanese-related sulfurtransferase